MTAATLRAIAREAVTLLCLLVFLIGVYLLATGAESAVLSGRMV